MRGTENTDLEIGQTVKILGRVNGESEMRGMAWVRGMDGAVGKTGVIIKTYDDAPFYHTAAKLDVPGYTSLWFVSEWLDITEPEIIYSDDDFNSVLI